MKNSKAEEPAQDWNRQTSGVLRLSIAIAFCLAVIKFLTGLATHSMSVMASALDSAMDVASSIVNFIAAREAAKPPDAEHAYGHGKIESLASLFQSAVVGLSGLYIIFESVKRMIVGSYVQGVSLGLGVMTFSLLVTAMLVLRLRSLARRNPSMVLAAENLHYATDIASHGGVILALVLVHSTGFVFWDLVVSVIVAAWIFRLTFELGRRSTDELLDRNLPPRSLDDIKRLILGFHPSVVGVHNFRSHCVSGKIFLDFHIEIRGEDDFKRAHWMTESLIKRIQEKYPGADVTVHFDPEGET